MKLVIVISLFVISVNCANDAPCHLPLHPSVTYDCVITDRSYDATHPRAFRACQGVEPPGTIVSPHCNINYYSTTAIRYMRCIDGEWDYIAKCIPECGIVTPAGTHLVLGGKSARRAEVPWHAGIYSKTTNPYMQICGGTLISNMIVISAAHCFWDNANGELPAESFAVAVGKLYRPWIEKMDQAQQSDVKELHFSEHYQGSTSYYQADIAVVIVKTPFKFNIVVRPVCVDFDLNFEKIQLQPGKRGKVAGWGLTAADGNSSQVLKVIELPYVPTGTCITESPQHFRPYITSDKFCAGYKNAAMTLCKGDSGGGLAFPDSGRGYERYYLRGIVSAAPNEDEAKCNENAITSFTQFQVHEHFVKQYWVGEEPSSEGNTIPTNDNEDGIIHDGDCRLPPFPQHGTFVTNVPAKPGQYVNSVLFNVTCDQGYKLEGSTSVFCYNGLWSDEFPKCVGIPCNKFGVDGVCTSLGDCVTAVDDLKNKKPLQVCAYGSELSVCCVPSPVTTTASVPILIATSTETCKKLQPWTSLENDSHRCYTYGNKPWKEVSLNSNYKHSAAFSTDDPSLKHVTLKRNSTGQLSQFELHFALETDERIGLQLSDKYLSDADNRFDINVGWDINQYTLLYRQWNTFILRSHTPNILSPNEFREFYLKINDGTIEFGKLGGGPLLTHHDPRGYSTVNYFQFYYFGSNEAKVRFDCPKNSCH